MLDFDLPADIPTMVKLRDFLIEKFKTIDDAFEQMTAVVPAPPEKEEGKGEGAEGAEGAEEGGAGGAEKQSAEKPEEGTITCEQFCAKCLEAEWGGDDAEASLKKLFSSLDKLRRG